MGKKKSFIDKKNSTTYTLTYGGGAADDDVPDGVSVSQGSAGRHDGYDGASAYGSEWGYSNYGDDSYVMTEARRKELLAMGFPDDGYDYLLHLRALGPQQKTSRRKPVQRVRLANPSQASIPEAGEAGPSAAPEETAGPAGFEDEEDQQEEEEEAVGPSVFVAGKFVPPPEDVQLVDARHMSLRSKAQDDEEAERAAATVSAFAKQAKLGTRGRLVHDLEELQQSMRQVEEDEEDPLGAVKAKGKAKVAPAGTPAASVVEVKSKYGGEVEGDEGDEGEGDDWGDWFDNFVVTAANEATIAEGPEGAESEEAEEGDLEEEEEEDEEEGRQGRAGAQPGRTAPGVAGSIASSYWRAERQDRKGELGGIDDRFEVLATQYEEDTFGEMDEDEAAGARNNAKISDFADLMDGFLREQAEMEAAQDEEERRQGAGSHHGRQQQQLRHGLEEDGVEDFVGGDEYDGVHGLGGSDDEGPGSSSRGSRQQQQQQQQPGTWRKMEALDKADAEVIAKTRARIAAAEEEASRRAPVGILGAGKAEGDEDVVEGEQGDIFDVERTKVFVDRDDRWDCESVLSLRSNLENHPARIAEPQARSGTRGGGVIKLSAKTGMPAAYAGGSSLTAAAVATASKQTQLEEDAHGSDGSDSEDSDAGHLEDGATEGGSVLLLERRKGETPEEKRARKAAVKEARRDQRASKKALKTMFKEEGSRQKKQAAGRGASGQAAGRSTFTIA